ncbi:hypothetical protein ETU10_06465 [Apibacter muscae]|uniref:hypothetical protein n=1 Tax=Apibacter muscae TaxID=2509004 RepID=UPI0011ADDB01|nr:hypothetical protein [Apibacter muscae]TWP23870.1 hypothetical protein ETU10_06465 [Apibacter muscae]
MKKIIPLLYVILLCSCVTRTSVPQIEGYVYDVKNTPIKDVKVCIDESSCIHTDSLGYFLIKRKTYKEMIRLGGEAPPVFYTLLLTKSKFSDTIIHYKNIYGGASSNLKVRYDTITLRKK